MYCSDPWAYNVDLYTGRPRVSFSPCSKLSQSLTSSILLKDSEINEPDFSVMDHGSQ